MSLRQKLTLISLVLCLVFAFVPMQGETGEQIAQMLKVTLSVYALARGLNAVISVAQGTEMSIEPMGVGLTLTPGEVLDPLNDLIEQFSAVLLLASASLGVQKILLILGDNWAIRCVFAVLAVVAIAVFFLPRIKASAKQWLFKLVVILTILRLMVPMLALVSHQTQTWLQSERTNAIETLETTQQKVDELNAQYREESEGWFSDLRNRFDISARLDNVEAKAEKAVEATVYLMAEFVLIMVLLPLLFIYLAIKLPLRY